MRHVFLSIIIGIIIASLAIGCTTAPTATPTAVPTTQAKPAAQPAAPLASPAPSPAASPAPKPAVLPSPSPSPVAAVDTSAPLLVNDAMTHNPSLLPVQVRLPGGGSSAQQAVRLPPGFSISIIAAGLQRPRFMAFDAEGRLLVADARAGNIYRYAYGANGPTDAPVAPPRAIAGGLNAPSNVAFHTAADGVYLYVGETTAISRFRYESSGSLGQRQVVVPDLPSGGHNTRTVAFGPDGKMYVAIGSSCNICTERDDRRATITRYNPDGSGQEIFARGLRNAVGLDFQPGTNILWATVNERDNQGNEIPPDLVTTVQAGKFYGWPGCQPPNAKPQESNADCRNVTPPSVGIQAHSAPLGMAFYAATRFPAEYHGDIFVVQHGSWNRQPPAEPKIMQIDMRDGQPVAARDFATGWQQPDGGRWGRPAGVVVAPDGALVVSDDQAGVIYRIAPTP